MLDHSPPTTLTLTLGQSRRMHLDHDATTVLVASPEIADVQLLAPNVLYVIGKGVGRTSVAVLDDNKWIEERVVAVVLDLEPLRTILAGEPDLSGVRARRLSRGMALTGEVASAASADRALRLAAGALPEGVPIENELRVAPPQQVNLEVQIAEVHRSVTEDLGVNWESFGINNSERFGFRIGRALPPVDGNLGLGAFPPTLIDGNLASSIFFGSEGPLGQFRVMIDALATAGLANVLARPNVTAISGESASFFSGGEFPLPTGFDDGVLVFSYKKYGVLLDFVPTVVDTGRIVLTVRPEVSEPSLNQSVTVVAGVNVPVINVRRAETTRALLQQGIADYLVKPISAAAVREASVTALDDLPDRMYAGRVVAFADTAGCGASTLVAAIARGMAAGGRTASVVDLDPVSGTLSTLLGAEPAGDLPALLATLGSGQLDSDQALDLDEPVEPDPSISPERLDSICAPAGAAGISLVAYPSAGLLPEAPSPPAVRTLLGHLANRAHVVLGAGLFDPDARTEIMQQADARLLLYEPTLPSISAAVHCLALLGSEHPTILVQCHPRMRRSALSPAQIRYALAERRPDVIIPFEPALHAAATGEAQDRPPGKAYRAALRQVIERAVEGPAPVPA